MERVKHLLLVAVHIAIYALVWWGAGGVVSGAGAILAMLLIWTSCRDIAVFEVPDMAAAVLVATGVLLGLDWLWAIAGAVAWAALFLVVREGARRTLGREALGLGDVKLMAGIGAWLGPVGPIHVTLFASLGAIAAMLAITLLRGERIGEISGTGIAFGPFLCLSTWAVWLGN